MKLGHGTPMHGKMQITERERLIVGWRGGVTTLILAINFCRRHRGSVVMRERDVIVIEVCATPAQLDAVLTDLPHAGITHLTRSGRFPVPRFLLWPYERLLARSIRQ